MSLHSAIDMALNQEEGFVITDSEPVPESMDRADFSRYRGKLVLWPFYNRQTDILLFLRALSEGVVPVLISPRTPSKKYLDIKHRYPRFGELLRNGRIAGSGLCDADRRVLLVLLTSGSTGKPKLVAATSRALEHGIEAIHQAQKLEDVRSTAMLLSAAYSFALINQLLWAVYFKRSLVIPPSLAFVADAMNFIRTVKGEMLCLTGAQANVLRACGFKDNEDFPDVKVVNFAGAPFPVNQFDFLKQIFPNAVFYNNYGCTEALPRLTVCEVKDKVHPVTRVGRVINGITLRINGGAECGKIEFKGPSASIGEVDAAGQVKEHTGWIASGDVGRLTGDRILDVYGRYDQIINVHGERISLMELESVLGRLANVDHALVWSVLSENEEPAPIAVINGGAQPDLKQVREHLKYYIPPNAWPLKIFWSGEWPLNTSGKTDRTQLQQAALEGKLELLWERRSMSESITQYGN